MARKTSLTQIINEENGKGNFDGFRNSKPINMIAMFPPIIGVAAGWGHSIAIGQDKGLWVWGHNKDVQLRIRLIKYKPIKIDDQDIIDVTSQVLAAGYYHSLALLKDNMCRCRLMDWGSNYYEQLSDGLQQDSMRPVEIMMTR